MIEFIKRLFGKKPKRESTWGCQFCGKGGLRPEVWPDGSTIARCDCDLAVMLRQHMPCNARGVFCPTCGEAFRIDEDRRRMKDNRGPYRTVAHVEPSSAPVDNSLTSTAVDSSLLSLLSESTGYRKGGL